ncbi:hypothetical protein KAS79_04125 [Candidatus Parcubacteria bacterium]|nr:hypothetical protein [Candidatus Parcubacteria bacterium]
MNTLKHYTENLLRLELFKKLHAKTFAELGELENNLLNAKAILQEEIKQTKQDVENENVKVSYIERYKKDYSYVKFLELKNEMEYNALDLDGGIKTEIDKKIFDECVKRGDISRETKQFCFKEQLLSTSVLIKSKI